MGAKHILDLVTLILLHRQSYISTRQMDMICPARALSGDLCRVLLDAVEMLSVFKCSIAIPNKVKEIQTVYVSHLDKLQDLR